MYKRTSLRMMHLTEDTIYSRFVKATRAFPEDREPEFPLPYKQAIPVSLPLSGMDVDWNKETEGLGCALHYPEV